jgi:hypothetical protein
VQADEKLTAFLELQRAIHAFAGGVSLVNMAVDKDEFWRKVTDIDSPEKLRKLTRRQLWEYQRYFVEVQYQPLEPADENLDDTYWGNNTLRSSDWRRHRPRSVQGQLTPGSFTASHKCFDLRNSLNGDSTTDAYANGNGSSARNLSNT